SASLAILCAIVIISSITMFLVLRRRRRHRADRVLFEMGVRDINVMDGIAFERFLEALFCRLGYVSEATQASGDYGVDVLLRRKKRRIAVQAKHYSAACRPCRRRTPACRSTGQTRPGSSRTTRSQSPPSSSPGRRGYASLTAPSCTR
ncbi:MAG: restriction endonuclease, partial [Nitrosopumilaceae archaeon]|nr:restriction endonuclease [Nitrosopumilaceae archaeon]